MKNETQSDILQSQTNAEENQNKETSSNNTELRKFHKVDKTPFTIVEENERFYMIMGNYKISERDFESQETCIRWELETHKWHTMGKYFFALLELSEKMKNT